MMGIEIRVAETEADLEAWRQVRIAVLPYERCRPCEWMREHDDPASGSISWPSSTASSPGRAGRSVGLRLRRPACARPAGLQTSRRRYCAAACAGRTRRRARLRAGRDQRRRSRIARVRRAVRRRRGRPADRTGAGCRRGAEPVVPEWLDMVSVADRPELWAAAYDPLALQAFADMATIGRWLVTREQWERGLVGLAGGDVRRARRRRDRGLRGARARR